VDSNVRAALPLLPPDASQVKGLETVPPVPPARAKGGAGEVAEGKARERGCTADRNESPPAPRQR